MADTLESLEIEVKHNSNGAASDISGLATALSGLKSAIVGAPDALRGVAEALKSISGALKGNLEKYGKFASSIADIAAAAELLGENSNHLETLANSMNMLSDTKLSVTPFNSLAKGMLNVAESAELVSPEAIANIERMTAALSKLQGVDLQGLGSAMTAVRKGGSARADAEPLAGIERQAISSANSLDVLRAKLIELQAAQQKAFEVGDSDKAYRLQGQILNVQAAIQRLENSALNAQTSIKELFTRNNTNAKLKADMESVRNQIEEVGKSASKNHGFLRRFTQSLKDMGKEAGKAKNPIASFISSLKRIAMYRFLRTVIKGITTAFKEGSQNAYFYAQAVGHSLAPALDMISTKTLTMTNQMGAAWATLLQTLQPIILQLIGLVNRLFSAITQLFSALGGGSTYLKAIDYSKQWADNTKKGAGAAKEWRNQLMGFDVINRLDEPSNGGGGAADVDDPSKMFEEVENELSSLSSFDIGAMIGDKLNGVIEKIRSVFSFDKIREIGATVADFFNGIFDTVNFEDVGRTVMDFFLSIPTLIIGFIEELDFADIATAISDFLTGAFDEASDWLDSIDWIQFGTDFSNKIADFFLNLDYLGVAESILNFLSSALKAAFGLLFGVYKGLWERGKENFANPVREWLKSLPERISYWLGYAIGAVGRFFANIGKNAVNFVRDALQWIKDPKNIKTLVDNILEWFSNLPSAMFNIGKKAIQGLWDGIRSLGSWLKDRLKDFLGPLWGTVKDSFKGFGEGVSNGFNGVKAYATGGFPEDGLFFANHNEIVGQFSNGQTAVANNSQIEAGISRGVRDANEDLISVVAEGFNRIIQSMGDTDSGDVDIGRFARAFYPYLMTAGKQRGSSLVSGATL